MDSYLLFLQYAQDEIFKLIDISLRFTQLVAESGREEELLLYPKIPIGYTTSTWTTQLRNFMGMHNLCIECTRGWQPRTQCVHDQMIMSLFLNKGISDYLLFHLNACRMYLQVTSIADMVTADCRYIQPEIVECNRIAQRSSQWTWPQQPKPTLQQQDNWKEAITKHLITQGSKKHLRLRQPLERWTGTPTSHWQYYYDQTTKRSWKHQEIDAKVWTV